MTKTEAPNCKCTCTLEQYEVSDLPRLGWITITDFGEENMYFTLPNGTMGFMKGVVR